MLVALLAAGAWGQEGELRVSASDAAARVPSPSELDAVRALRVLRDPKAPSPEELAPKLRRSELVGLFLDVLVARTVPALDGEPEQILSEVQERLALAVLGGLERGLVLDRVEGRLAVRADVPARRAALLCFAAAGRAGDLERILSLALEPGEARIVPDLAEPFRRSVAAVLVRDPDAYGDLVELTFGSRDELLDSLVLAVGEAGDPRGLDFLDAMVTWRPEVAVLAASRVPLIGPSRSTETNELLIRHLRPLLDPEDHRACRTVALALGALEDVESVPDLIDLLEHENASVRTNALWALRQVSRQSFPAVAATWRSWFEREVEWFQHERPKIVHKLHYRDDAKVVEAVRQIAHHVLFRDELSVELSELLFHKQTGLRALAARTLGELGSPRAVPELVQALNDRREEVREAAWEALREITGLELPRSADVWRNRVLAGA